MLTVDGYLDDGRVSTEVVITLESIGPIIGSVGMAYCQYGVTLAYFYFEFVIRLNLIVIAQEHRGRFRETTEWNLEYDIFTLLEDCCVLEPRWHVYLRRTCNISQPDMQLLF